jgi:hypothetical protein
MLLTVYFTFTVTSYHTDFFKAHCQDDVVSYSTVCYQVLPIIGNNLFWSDCTWPRRHCQDLAKRLNFSHCKDTIPKILNIYSQKRNCAATVPISTFICLSAIYKFPRSVCQFCCRKICGPILGIYTCKSLTNT